MDGWDKNPFWEQELCSHYHSTRKIHLIQSQVIWDSQIAVTSRQNCVNTSAISLPAVILCGSLRASLRSRLKRLALVCLFASLQFTSNATESAWILWRMDSLCHSKCFPINITTVKRLQKVYGHCTGLLKRVTEREDCCQVQPWMRVFNFVSVLSEREKM